MKHYDYHIYSVVDGDVSIQPIEIIESVPCWDDGIARSIARKLAKKHRGPVDVALAGKGSWNERYYGTASPHWWNEKATTWERLD